MHRTDASNNIASEPSPTSPGTAGWYRQSGPPWTTSDPEHLNAMSKELENIATMKGASLSKANRGQCAEALDAVLAIETDASSVSNTTCVNKRMVAVSSGATATGNHSAVIASKKTTTNNAASGAQSAVIASAEAVASGDQSAVLASSDGATASGANALVAAAVDSTASGDGSAIIATAGDNTSAVSGNGCASLASDGASVSGKYNASVASTLGQVGGATTSNMNAEIGCTGCTTGANGTGVYRAVTIASDGCDNDGLNNCAIIGSEDCDILAADTLTEVVMLASNLVTSLPNTADGDVVGGFNGGAGANVWRIDGSAGTYYGAGGAVASGADYAEMFPALDGPHAPGRLLARKGKSCRLAQPGDRVLGVVSVNPTVVGGDSDSWHGRYVRDEWGQIVRNDDGRTLKQAAGYDPTREQVMRRDRPDEWTCVGLVGQLRLAIDDTVSAETEFIAPGADGIGTHSDEESRGACVELMEIEKPYDKRRGYGIALVFIR